jgi:hypothetical protein
MSEAERRIRWRDGNLRTRYELLNEARAQPQSEELSIADTLRGTPPLIFDEQAEAERGRIACRTRALVELERAVAAEAAEAARERQNFHNHVVHGTALGLTIFGG